MDKKWFLLSIVSLGLGGFLAFVVAMARTPGVYKYFPPGYFYYALIGHVDLAIVIFLLSFTILIWSRTYKKDLKLAFYLSSLGFVGVALSAFLGKGIAVSNNYLPTIVHPLFLSGIALYFLGFTLYALYVSKEALLTLFSKDPTKNSVATSVVLGLLMMFAVIPSYLRAGDPSDTYIFYERLFWAPGHIHQFLNGAVLLYAWYYLLRLLGKEKELGFLRFVNLSFLFFSFLMLLVPVFYSDPISRDAKIFTEISYAIGLGIPMFFHAFNVVKDMKLDWKNPFSSALLLSLCLYFLGVLIAYAGIKADLRVPAHYHGTVTSLTLALMAISYRLVQEYGYTKKLNALTKFQPYLYGLGMIMFILGLYFAGREGAPRKTYGTGYTQDPTVLFSLMVMGLGTMMAVIGGVLFVLYILKQVVSYHEDKG
ncbi:cbb3-type cytochrome c oxidase subunit I [Hydrogenobacter hydrogenophilus]|uniref:Heme/copper-type cytochrome/quinol oxidase, subunit 1 n=1 Tax=Hydrogenobacter hydrogenophilus TaxID=35835 RepID=A0A285P479_9AQUI|nr:cbb3-type cytochrome c oxidase subunit I [Hydrogenobacter hydrogenophilus]SNZ16535.1 Heme/copper-type cytochrome/quinol oxidase, subunit 1 [Hydrogenobacter hydrogenophilus]